MKHCHLYFTTNPLSVENLFLKLCAKMLLASQIAEFFKVQYLKKEGPSRYFVCKYISKFPTSRYYSFGLGGQVGVPKITS